MELKGWLGASVFNGRRKAYFLTALGTAVTITAASLLIYLFNLSYFLGPFRFRDLLFGLLGEGRIRVALLESRYTDSYFASVGGNYGRLLHLWKALLDQERISYQVIGDREIERGSVLASYDVVILPAAVALSDTEVQRLKDFVHSGKGLVADWATATRGADGNWRGWQFLQEVAGIEFMEMAPRDPNKSLLSVVRGDSPLGRGLPIGYRLENFSYNEIILARSRDPDAYWSYEQTPVFRPPNPLPLAGITRWIYGKGRTVWFGFSVDSIRNRAEDREVLGKMIANAITWAAHRPMALIAPWPRGAPMAAVFALDSEEQFPNATRVVDLFARANIQGTFFMLSEFAERYPQVVEMAKKTGEIAIHGDTHTPFAGQSLEVQYQRLSKAEESLGKLSGERILSFHPPEERYDENTIAAMARANLQILFTRLKDRSSPKIISVGNPPRPLVIVPQPYLDDHWALEGMKLTPPQALEQFKADLDRATLDAGLYTLSFHTTPPFGLAQENLTSILDEMIRYAKAKGAWITRIDTLAQWWLAREQVNVKATHASDFRTILSITNSGSKTIPALRVDFFPPRMAPTIQVKAEPIYRFFFNPHQAMLSSPEEREGSRQSSFNFTQKHERLVMQLYDLGPGETRTFLVDQQEKG